MNFSLLLDNADPLLWERWMPIGIFSGITTNPTLLRQAKQPCTINSLKFLARKAESLGCKEIHFQAWGGTYQELFECGIALGELATKDLNVYIKVPITFQGSQAAKELIKSNLSITFTACYEIQQILIAAAIGVEYIAPYMGRISDLGIDAFSELVSMQKTLDNINSNCKILVASIRKKSDIVSLLNEGLNTFTISPRLAEDLFNVKETVKASDDFERAAKGIK